MQFLMDYPIDKVIDYIADLSNDNKHRIEYMDNHPDSIRFELEHIALENPGIETIYVAEEDDEIKCLFVIDIDDTHTNIIGPFTKSYDLTMIMNLFEYALDNVNKELRHLEFAINGDNAVALLFVEEIGAALYEENYVLVKTRESYKHINSLPIKEMESDELEEVVSIFDTVFPQYRFNYYPETDAEEHKIYVTHDEEKNITGFVHVVIKPEFNDGLISYLAVHPDSRNQGIGKILMQAGLNKIFEYDDITEAYLRVDIEDKFLAGFYENLGFEISIHTKIYRLELIQ